MQQVFDLLDPERAVNMVVDFVPKLAAAALVLLTFWVLLKITQPPLRAALQRANFVQTLVHLLVDNVYKTVILGIGVIMAASQLGINVGAALAGIGVAGVAVGFAAQESVANSIAGFMIFWDKPFKIGDYIRTQGEYGKVAHITMRTTRIKTLNNTYIVIPNKEIIGGVLVNHSMYGETRVEVPVGIAYKESIPRAREVLLEAVRGVEGVIGEPAPTVVTTELGGSSVNLKVMVWVSDAELERPVFVRVLEASKLALDRAGIEIPYPHLQLFFDDIRPPVWQGLRTVLGVPASGEDNGN